jgi:hypothetical protein
MEHSNQCLRHFALLFCPTASTSGIETAVALAGLCAGDPAGRLYVLDTVWCLGRNELIVLQQYGDGDGDLTPRLARLMMATL